MSNQPFCKSGKIDNLPLSANHGDEICDSYGNRYQYDAGQDAWISRGTIALPDTVSENKDGIITPNIYDQLLKLEAFTKNNPDLRPLKILPGSDAYWYYFKSSDKLIKFKAEGENQLRIEVDKARIYQILLKNKCPGPRGPQGDPGDRGPSGRHAVPEPYYSPSTINTNRLDFAIFTPTPLKLGGPVPLPNDHVPEISVRVYAIDPPKSTISAQKSNESLQLAYLEATLAPLKDSRPELYQDFTKTRWAYQQQSMGVKPSVSSLCGIKLSKVMNGEVTTQLEPVVIVEIDPIEPNKVTVSFRSDVPSDKLSLDNTLKSIKYDRNTNIVCGSIYLPVGSSWDKLFVAGVGIKSRQKGPDGVSGDPGDCKIRLVNCEIDTESIRADCPIINVRLDCEDDVIYTLCSDLITSICARFINISPNADIISDAPAFTSTFVALETTLDECKKITSYRIDLQQEETPELELPNWEPQPGCVKKRNFNRHKFNWIPATAIGPCAEKGRWFGPNGVRASKYPWRIQRPKAPPADECCQEPFFWCPNVQDPPCSDNTSQPPPPGPVDPSP